MKVKAEMEDSSRTLVKELQVTKMLEKAAAATKKRNEKLAAMAATIVSAAVQRIKLHIENEENLARKYSITVEHHDDALDCCERVRAELSRVLEEAGWQVTRLDAHRVKTSFTTFIRVRLEWPTEMETEVTTKIQEAQC
ncbi:hypothetical protein HDU87_006178 [Geranomyces variabilis]|uniref:Uncharacterized protein n=1 Tax=Geranomyces variabilis TaxID=109894 RepID=A0AAD5XQS6_9FUNG|nr:hypothetical protein HDU87_006178 [Geranomyces variabilis]